MIKLTRALHVQLREHEDEDDRTYRFTASTETPVDVFGTPEVLRADGVDLSRFERNPVVLNTHQHGDVSQIVGKATMRVEGAEVVGRVTFTEATQAGREALALARDGMLSAVSVGFEPRKARELRRGETDGEGERQVTGPARVVTEWSLLELSVVPVPADPNAVKRAYQEIHMSQREAVNGGDDEGEEGAEGNGKKARDLIDKAEGMGFTIKEIAAGTDRSPGVIGAIKSGEIKNPPTDFLEKIGSMIANGTPENTSDDDRGEKPKHPRADDDDDDDDDDEEEERTADGIVARQVEDRRRLIMSFCPCDLRSFAEGLLLEDPQITPALARAALIAERERTMRPVGTPPAPASKRGGNTSTPTTSPDACTASGLVSALRKE